MTDREPVGRMLNSVLETMNEIVAMANSPETYDDVAVEIRTLGCILTRMQIVVDVIRIRQEAEKVWRVS